jgi:Ala-tRNA(Pro) deacylase
MAVNPRLQQLLSERGVAFEVIPHREAFTAGEAAMTSHVPRREFAKVVVVRDDAGGDFLAVLPAGIHMNTHVMRRVTGRHGIALEDEAELNRLFPDCEVGAMPPFGMLYGMPMYVDPCLSLEPDIVFQAGNHHEVVRMKWEDYDPIARPFHMTACLHTGVEAMAG